MATKLKKSDEQLMLQLSEKILSHCAGKTLAEIACFVGSLACGTLHHVAAFSSVDIKTYLLDFADTLRQSIEETL